MSARASEWEQVALDDEAAGDVRPPDPCRPHEPSTPAIGTHSRPTGRIDLARAANCLWRLAGGSCGRLWANFQARRATQRRRSLRVVESVSMGEKRFVAIVQVEQARFLVGGGSAGVSLLARLDPEQEFAAVLDQRAAAAPVPERVSASAFHGAAGERHCIKVGW